MTLPGTISLNFRKRNYPHKKVCYGFLFWLQYAIFLRKELSTGGIFQANEKNIKFKTHGEGLQF